MKKISKIILQFYLKILAKLALFLHNPKIIVVAGSANKFFVKEDIKKELKSLNINSRVNPKNFNTEIGLALSILNLPSGYNSLLAWLPAIKKAPLAIFRKMPEFLILSLGTANPGDMKYLMSIVKPDIAVITEINQRYLEGFKNMDALVLEYEYLAKNIKETSFLIYNYDNSRTKTLKNKTKAKVSSFGEKEGSDWKIINKRKNIKGFDFKLKNNNEIKNISLERFGQHHIYSKIISLIISDYVIRNKKI
jgi:UDP-N-acetylmuramoyl-tripeptide--D-alanyl-D-alanine ligase